MDVVEVRDAATVALLRDAPSGVEVWLLTRVRQMVFAAGMAVFAGGRVDPGDTALPLTGDLDAVAVRLGCDREHARALAGAAVRETFEETGVLLTVPPVELGDARADVEDGRLPFGTLLREHGLAVDVAALHPWARWITPEGEVRRYDTRFFVARLPDGAEAREGTTESSAAGWVRPGDALEAAQRGELQLLPPTAVTLAAVARHASVADVLAAADERPLAPVEPSLVRDADGSLRVELADGTSFALPSGGPR